MTTELTSATRAGVTGQEARLSVWCGCNARVCLCVKAVGEGTTLNRAPPTEPVAIDAVGLRDAGIRIRYRTWPCALTSSAARSEDHAGRCHGIASAQAMCPSNSSDLAVAW